MTVESGHWANAVLRCSIRLSLPIRNNIRGAVAAWVLPAPVAPEGSSFVNASSYHPGGCNFAFADGSVKFIKDSVNMATYQSLGTRKAGK